MQPLPHPERPSGAATYQEWEDLIRQAEKLVLRGADPASALQAWAASLAPRVATSCLIDVVDRDRLVQVYPAIAPAAGHAPGPLESGVLSQHVLRTGEFRLIANVQEEQLDTMPRLPQTAALLHGAVLMVPLRAQPEVVGVMTLAREATLPPFDAREQDYAERLGRILGSGIQRARHHTRLVNDRNQLETILGVISDAITVVDRHGRIIYANAAAARLSRVPSPSTLLSMSDEDVLRPFDVFAEDGTPIPLERLPGRLALNGIASENMLLHYRHRATGEEGWSMASASPLKSASGDVEAAVSVFRDVTDDRAAFEARSRLAAIVDSSDDAILSKDLTGRILSWNRGAQQIFGYQAHEMVGKSIKTLIPPELQDEEDVILARIRSGQHVDHYETRRMRKDGRILDISLTVSPVRDPSGRIVGASKIARDITERKRAQEQLRQLNQQLEQRVRQRTKDLELAVRELETFNYTVSHDLRTPLRAITGFTKLLLAEIQNPNQRQQLEYILDGAQEMTRITETLLRLTRIREPDLRKSHVDITTMAKEIFARLRRHDPQRNVETQVDEGLGVTADTTLVEVVLENLIGNAWKFTSKNPDARIHVGRRPFKGQQAFFVEDNGVGFSKSDTELLFKPFQRLRPLEFEGSGIGLATVQRIIRIHGGGIEAEGEPGARAVIYFWLP